MSLLRIVFSLLALSASPVMAQVDLSVDCGVARDPERCEARQAAIAACADQRGAAKNACIAQYLPPPDCSKASDPAKCTAIERAKETCRAHSGKALKACLRGESPAKAKGASKATKKKAGKKPAQKKKTGTAGKARPRAPKATGRPG